MRKRQGVLHPRGLQAMAGQQSGRDPSTGWGLSETNAQVLEVQKPGKLGSLSRLRNVQKAGIPSIAF